SKSIPGIEGRPCDAWMLGYVWAMAQGWKQLTTLPITTRGRFPRFLEQGLKVLKPDREILEWESLIKTAIQRFRLKGEKPLQPGNDLALFQVEKLTPDCERLRIAHKFRLLETRTDFCTSFDYSKPPSYFNCV